MSAERMDATTTAGLVREWFETPVGDNGGRANKDPRDVLALWTQNFLHGHEVELPQFIIRNGRLYFLPGWTVWPLHSSTAVQTLATLIEEQQ